MPYEGYNGAPYNFIALPDRYLPDCDGTIRKLPPHNVIDPKLRSGKIKVTFEAQTPVFLSDGAKPPKVPQFFRNAAGICVIPGSTIRGLIRTNMVILGMGAMVPGEDLDNRYLMFREVASRGELSKHYRDIISPEDGSEGVKAGYLYHTESDQYYILPVSGGRYYPVKRKSDPVLQIGAERAEKTVISVWYQLKDGTVQTLSRTPKEGFLQGDLLCPGHVGPWETRYNRNGKKIASTDTLYLFPSPDQTAKKEIPSEQDILTFQQDLHVRANVLGREELAHWSLPEMGAHKPVFYLPLSNKQLCWGSTRYIRIIYDHPIGDGLPEKLTGTKETQPIMDYPRSILGYACGKKAYRSRVSFGDFALTSEERFLPERRLQLQSPKPTSVLDYLEQPDKHRITTYQTEGFRLRGVKQYWLQPAQESSQPPQKRKADLRSALRPLDIGSTFCGEITFRNLYEDELGLLLWCIQLRGSTKCYHSLGQGKPYGYGRMEITNLDLRLFDLEKMYTAGGLCTPYQNKQRNEIKPFIAAYWAHVRMNYGIKLMDQPRIRDFFTMRSTIAAPEDVRYMTIAPEKEYQNRKKANPLAPLPTVSELKTRWNRR